MRATVSAGWHRRGGPGARAGRRGFTLVELLTVLAIITILVGMLVPSLNMARRVAKETKQKAQFTAIGAGLEAFRKDYGDYPPSLGWKYDLLTGEDLGDPLDYGGAQKLCEALLGRDLMGFHPLSQWHLADAVYPKPAPVENLQERRGRYIELHTANAFRLGDNPVTGEVEGLFANTSLLAEDTYVLCDVFAKKRIDITNPGPDGVYGTLDDTTRPVKAGAPVLYYRANTSSKILQNGPSTSNRIYNVKDNQAIAAVKEFADGKTHPLAEPTFVFFYDYIRDPKVPGYWPYRPDSYILISAGMDGIYGTPDDIKNFGY
ncbi:MAG: type II secretion system protein [Planctomycetota bacterium]